MTFELTLTASGIKELSLTTTTLYLEVARLGLFLNIWDMPVGGRWIGASKQANGKGLELRLGPVVLMAGVAEVETPAALLSM